MKTYMGIPGEPNTVTVTEGANTTKLEPKGPVAWGKKSNIAGGPELALAILDDFFQDNAKALRVYRRFLYRTVVGWNEGLPFTITSAEIAAILKDIGETDTEMGKIRDAVNREMVPVANEGGMGPGGSSISAIERKA